LEGLTVFEILRLPAFEDNYLFVLVDSANATAAVVDPGDGMVILNALKAKDLQLTHIFLTHHHGDHLGGVRLLQECFPEAHVFASAYDVERNRIPTVSKSKIIPLESDDSVAFAGRKADIVPVPGHTLGHIAYVFEKDLQGVIDVFIGDTLFGGGCGGIFEGTHAQMLANMQTLRNLPDQTRLWCAHEYTEKNLWVALQLPWKCEALKNRFEETVALRLQNQPTVPLHLGVEKQTNPFLLWDDPHLCQALKTAPGLETFSAVRRFRDKF
jgi:hydroxyacylglutathione hydrolase